MSFRLNSMINTSWVELFKKSNIILLGNIFSNIRNKSKHFISQPIYFLLLNNALKHFMQKNILIYFEIFQNE